MKTLSDLLLLVRFCLFLALTIVCYYENHTLLAIGFGVFLGYVLKEMSKFLVLRKRNARGADAIRKQI